MEMPDSLTGDEASSTRRELQGPRPTPLRVRKDSYKIKKPPVAPQPSHPLAAQRPPPSQPANRQPVIIYAVSPKVIHTTVNDFMNLVQRLTGSSDSYAASARGGDVSPAARLASIEMTSPSEREREREKATDLMGMIEGVEVGQFQGILSPAPASLPQIPPGFFSSGSDPNTFSLLNDLSPFMLASNMFIPSPSTLFSGPMISPSPSSFDLLNQFLNF